MTGSSLVLEAKASSKSRQVFDKVLAGADRASYYGIVAAMGMMTFLVSAQVFTRYVLSSSIDSADELSRLFFVWAIFLAIPQGIKAGIHVGIDVLVTKLSENWQRQLSRITALCSAVLMALLIWVAAGAVGDKWQELMPTVEMTAAVFYIAVLVCAVHSLMHLIALIWQPDR